ncbi:Family 2 glycosyl transferase [Candidatus Desulfarcum epimagneticum]|uniref:Family 2 glycosyl transferase n=1 Tax=uncultured Desulfobacteraceae bacterium TaxID=218296 RepID=A0A484HI95_9BACT|nr:Family 2 glycosyl transferase [uncultured Desulfobacteraceae bacterium]
MKLIIQIPCRNEEKTVGLTLSQLPRKLEGVDVVEWLVIDDGSSDRTVEEAKYAGVDHIVRLNRPRGLAAAFMAGLRASLEAGADIIVNTDADNQYRAGSLPDLIRPVLEKKADMVIGERPIDRTPHFSYIKKKLEKLGSLAVRIVSGADVPDAASGFRAMSRKTAARLNVFSAYTYTLETIIQAGQKGMSVSSVPVKTNPPTRPSRLVKSVPGYIGRSVMTIARIFAVYRPFVFFTALGMALMVPGVVIGLRFLYFFFFTSSSGGHIQSLIFACILIIMGFQSILSAFIADLLSVNRRMLEDLQYKDREKRAG